MGFTNCYFQRKRGTFNENLSCSHEMPINIVLLLLLLLQRQPLQSLHTWNLNYKSVLSVHFPNDYKLNKLIYDVQTGENNYTFFCWDDKYDKGVILQHTANLLPVIMVQDKHNAQAKLHITFFLVQLGKKLRRKSSTSLFEPLKKVRLNMMSWTK